jgi:hypothetical protein
MDTRLLNWINDNLRNVSNSLDNLAKAINKNMEIESRLSALEEIIACDGIDARLHQPSAQPAEMVTDERIAGVIYGLNLAKSMAENLARLNVGSIPGRLLTDIEAMKHDFQCGMKPAETKREWIKFTDPPNVTVWYWDTYKGRNEVRKLMASELSEGDMWMPYRKGDKQPEPPKGS